MAIELHKLKTAEVRGFEAAQLRETEQEIRRELVKIRMDIYTAKNASGAKVRGLKTSLARVLTVVNEKAAKGKASVKAAPSKTTAKVTKSAKADKAPMAAKKTGKAKTTTK